MIIQVLFVAAEPLDPRRKSVEFLGGRMPKTFNTDSIVESLIRECEA